MGQHRLPHQSMPDADEFFVDKKEDKADRDDGWGHRERKHNPSGGIQHPLRPERLRESAKDQG